MLIQHFLTSLVDVSNELFIINSSQSQSHRTVDRIVDGYANHYSINSKIPQKSKSICAYLKDITENGAILLHLLDSVFRKIKTKIAIIN